VVFGTAEAAWLAERCRWAAAALGNGCRRAGGALTLLGSFGTHCEMLTCLLTMKMREKMKLAARRMFVCARTEHQRRYAGDALVFTICCGVAGNFPHWEFPFPDTRSAPLQRHHRAATALRIRSSRRLGKPGLRTVLRVWGPDFMEGGIIVREPGDAGGQPASRLRLAGVPTAEHRSPSHRVK
jgi:hypothetical protein